MVYLPSRNKRILLSCILFIHYLLIKTISAFENAENGLNVFCSNHIYEKESNLSTYEINDLCKLVANDRRFIIQLDPSEFIDAKLYQRYAREFFLKKCREAGRSVCYRGYCISVYNSNIQTLSLSMGEYSSKQLSLEQRNRIVSKAIRAVSICEGIMIVIREIEKIVPVQSDDMIPISNGTDSDQEGIDRSNKVNPIVILIIILIPFLLIALLVFFIFHYNTMIDINDVAPSVIHDYFTTLQIFHKEISANKAKMITLNKCILCFKVINPHLQKVFFEMDEIKPEETLMRNTAIKKTSKEMPLLRKSSLDLSIDNVNTRFSCGHVFHNECLLKIKSSYCLMCKDKEESIVIVNRSGQQVIKDSNVICLLYNFNKIYSQAELSHYNAVYSNELEEAKDKFAKRKLFLNSMN